MTFIIDDVQHSINDEDPHQYYENRASLMNTVAPQPESPVFNDECLPLQDDNRPSLDQQTAQNEDIPTTDHEQVLVTAEDSEYSQLADHQQKRDDTSSHSDQDQRGVEETCNSPQIEHQDGQQLAATFSQLEHQDHRQSHTHSQLEHQDNQQSDTHGQLEHWDNHQQSANTQVEHQDSQLQSDEQSQGDLKSEKESGEVTQGLVLTKEGEEILKENQFEDKPSQGVDEGNSLVLAATVEDHMVHSEGHYQQPRAVKLLDVRTESVEETETKKGIHDIVFYHGDISYWDGASYMCWSGRVLDVCMKIVHGETQCSHSVY